MTQTATIAGKDQRINFLSIFNRSKNETIKSGLELISTSTPEHPLLSWFKKSNYLEVINTKSLSAGIFPVGHVTIRFKLSSRYSDRFILFRGLVEFSRPKSISISSNASEKSFELRVADDQINSVKAYLDTILSLLTKEIKFKASLQAVLKFEKSYKEQQSKFYQELRALA